MGGGGECGEWVFFVTVIISIIESDFTNTYVFG